MEILGLKFPVISVVTHSSNRKSVQWKHTIFPFARAKAISYARRSSVSQEWVLNVKRNSFHSCSHDGAKSEASVIKEEHFQLKSVEVKQFTGRWWQWLLPLSCDKTCHAPARPAYPGPIYGLWKIILPQKDTHSTASAKPNAERRIQSKFKLVTTSPLIHLCASVGC